MVSVQVLQKQSHTELEHQQSHTVLQYLVTVLRQRRCCEQNGRKKSDSRSHRIPIWHLLKYETLQILTL